MARAIVTGSGGLVGSETVSYLVEAGFDVTGVENDMRSYFFGPEASTRPQTRRLLETYGAGFRSLEVEIRDADAVDSLFGEHSPGLELVVHTAAQPSHDWAASEPQTDFTINANGTLNLLEATRKHCPDATFVFASTNKVYGDRPNSLPLVENETRLELPEEHEYYDGIPTSMPIDQSLHSLFGVSKAAADLLVQEYGRYFGIPTVCFRGGCLTGPNHAGARLHGFLSYLMRCTVTGERYTVHGYGGKQVRDNLHSADLVRAFAAFHAKPQTCVGLQHRRRARERTARCWKQSRCVSRLPAARSTGKLAGGGTYRRPPLVDQRLGRVHPRLPGVESDVRHRGQRCGRSTSRTWRPGARPSVARRG